MIGRELRHYRALEAIGSSGMALSSRVLSCGHRLSPVACDNDLVTPRSSIRAGRRGVRRGCGFLGTRPTGVPGMT